MLASGTRYRRLETALAVVLGAYLLAPVAVALLLSGLPIFASLAERTTYMATHPWSWRIGWLLAALPVAAEVPVALVMLRNERLSRLRTTLAMLLTLPAVGMQLGGVALAMGLVGPARAAMAAGDLAPMAVAEANTLAWLVGWGWIARALQGLAWTWCIQDAFGRAGIRRLSWPLWTLFAVAGAATLVWAWSGFPFALSAGLGVVATGGLVAWVSRFQEGVLTEAAPSPPLPVGTSAPWYPPRVRGLDVHAAIALANGRLYKRVARRVATVLPPPRMRADVKEVVVICFIVPLEQMRPFVPSQLDLIPLDPESRWTLLTLVLQHNGHMGPRFLGPARRLTSSTLQLDWRAQVAFNPPDGRAGIDGAYVVSGAIDSTFRALAVRVWSEGLPMHRPLRLELQVDHGPLRIEVEPGEGTAPDLHAVLRGSSEVPELPEPFNELFADWDALMEQALSPRRILSVQPHLGWVSSVEWRLNLDRATCRPLEIAELSSRFGEALHAGAPAVAFSSSAGGRLDVHPPVRLPLHTDEGG